MSDHDLGSYMDVGHPKYYVPVWKWSHEVSIVIKQVNESHKSGHLSNTLMEHQVCVGVTAKQGNAV